MASAMRRLQRRPAVRQRATCRTRRTATTALLRSIQARRKSATRATRTRIATAPQTTRTTPQRTRARRTSTPTPMATASVPALRLASVTFRLLATPQAAPTATTFSRTAARWSIRVRSRIARTSPSITTATASPRPPRRSTQPRTTSMPTTTPTPSPRRRSSARLRRAVTA